MPSRIIRIMIVFFFAAVFLTGTAAYGITIPKKTDKQAAKQQTA